MKKKIKIMVLLVIFGICSASFSVKAEDEDSRLFTQGYELMQIEDYYNAAEIYKKLYDKYENSDNITRRDNVSTYNNLAICYEELGYLYLSNEVREKAVLMADSDRDYAYYFYKLSSSYNDMGFNDMALCCAKNGLGTKDNTYTYELYIEYGDALFDMKRYDNAAQFYRKAGEYAPDRLVQVEEKLAFVALAKKDYAAAIEKYKNIIKLDEEYKEYAYKKIINIEVGKNKEILETQIEKYLIQELEYSDNAIANYLHNYGYYKEAIVYYDKVLNENETKIEAIYWKANALKKIGEYKEAIELFKIAYENDPTYESSLANIIECYNSLGEFEKSNQYCDLLLEQSPFDSYAIAFKNINYTAISDFANAASVINSIVDKKNMPYYIYNAYLENLPVVTEKDIIEIYSQMDEFPKEENQQVLYIINHISLGHFSTESLENYGNYLERFLEKEMQDDCVILEYAKVLGLNGKYKEAYMAYKSAGGYQFYGTEEIIELHINNIRKMYLYDKALQITKEAQESFPLNDNFKEWEARILYSDMNKPEEAIKIFEELLKDNPQNTRYMEDMMRVYDALEDYENVLNISNQILDIFHDNIYAKAYKAKALQKLNRDGADAIIEDIDNRQYSTCDSTIISVNSVLGREEFVYNNIMSYLKEHPAKGNIERFSLDYDMKQSLDNESIALLLNIQPLKQTYLPEKLQNPMITILITVFGLVLSIGGIFFVIKKGKK